MSSCLLVFIILLIYWVGIALLMDKLGLHAQFWAEDHPIISLLIFVLPFLIMLAILLIIALKELIYEKQIKKCIGFIINSAQIQGIDLLPIRSEYDRIRSMEKFHDIYYNITTILRACLITHLT